jgi:predicted N-acetyltransferase YhbS
LISERPEHGPAIERLLDQSFGEARWHKTCQRLRDGRAPIRDLSLVAIADRTLIGTVRLWPMLVGGRRALLLGPLAVDGRWRNHGVGSALMEETLKRAETAGERAVILIGDAPYYRRFGFEQKRTAGLWLPGPVDPSRFLAREFAPKALEGASGPVMALAA